MRWDRERAAVDQPSLKLQNVARRTPRNRALRAGLRLAFILACLLTMPLQSLNEARIFATL